MHLQVLFVLVTTALFLVTLVVNTYLLQDLVEHVPGIAWVYLPAGVRLLCILLFGAVGAAGVLLGSVCAGFYFFPDNHERAVVGGIIGSIAPFLVYLWAQRCWSLHTSLKHVSHLRLMGLSFGCAVASPLLHHLYFAWKGQENLLSGFFAMVVGDLTGTMIVLYAAKMLIRVVEELRSNSIEIPRR